MSEQKKECDLWTTNWNNAYKFFNSKGNVQTRSRLKDKWHKDFFEGVKYVETITRAAAMKEAEKEVDYLGISIDKALDGMRRVIEKPADASFEFRAKGGMAFALDFKDALKEMKKRLGLKK